MMRYRVVRALAIFATLSTFGFILYSLPGDFWLILGMIAATGILAGAAYSLAT